MSATERLQPPLRLAYLVSRFPKTTETFVVRELNEVANNPEIDVQLYSVFPPREGAALVHPSAEPWIHKVRRPSMGDSIRSALRWTLRRPVQMTVMTGMLVWGFGHRPRQLVASLTAMVIGCGLADEMQRERIEHVHAHFVGHPATAAWVIQRLTGIEYSVTAHAYELFQDYEFLKPRVRAAQFVVAISRFNAEFLYRFCKGRIAPITVIRAGIVLEDFPYRERRVPKAGPVQALAVGSMIEHKGHRVLLEALADPALARVNVTLVGYGAERQNLEAAAQAAGLSDRVRFVGARREDEVAELMAACDLFVLPSLIAASGQMEGVPVVLMEAMASGAPVVASNLSGIPELVIDGKTGRLAVQGDAASLRAQIAATLADPDSAKRMARAARKHVEGEFDVRRSAARLAEWFLAARATARVDTQNIHA